MPILNIALSHSNSKR